ncbi:ATP-binding protein [Ancylobacter sonchi]|uniref:ATP-binding protein n=1 Tax=Ancylobacter sonchi TaxID=1937790 RepID=UPI001BD1C588|nr:ATP-binding protein [Ancylobacter sonchi]MBS7533204.1 ATP-binding protein [Ancylobacter sonchi]
MSAARADWVERNQRHLAAELARLRLILQRRLANGDAPAAPPAAAPSDDHGTDPADTGLGRLSAGFRLSPFERDLLLLCAGVELDSEVARLCAALHGDPLRRAPSFGLALAVLPGAHWSAVAPTGPLRRWGLIEPGRSEALTEAPLGIDETILHRLAGLDCPDPRLDGLITDIPPGGPLTPSQAETAERLVDLWRGVADGQLWPAVQLCGEDRLGQERVAAAACATAGLALWRLDGVDIPASPRERVALARLCERELVLKGGALMLSVAAGGDTRAERGLLAFVEEMAGPLVLALDGPLVLTRRPSRRLEVNRPAPAERRMLWAGTLGPLASGLNGRFDAMVDRFRLDGAGIEAACATAQDGGRDGEDEPGRFGDRLWAACRVQARRRLDTLAERIESRAAWADLVLPAPQQALLAQMALHVRHATTVYERWGFAGKTGRGLGISALFAGTSGTGKTMAAEVLANDLGLDLYRIDLSQTVSKYIGETEKNLRVVFDTAEESGAVLLFDEADALFGKRSEVKDSHDRYANIEVSYLLQRMEAYRGLAILTTNLRSAIDPAFLRRIRFVVQFPFPDATHRSEIWRRVFPPDTPTRDLDPDRLAQLTLAGGHIRNVAMNAAFLAAGRGEAVGMEHLRQAALAEYAKLEKPATSAELGGWQ